MQIMNNFQISRRNFVKTSAGFLAMLVAPGIWQCNPLRREKKRITFKPYRQNETLCKVICVTPEDGFYIHTFYDVCPFSPNERYLAVTKLPFQDRDPLLGDIADICIIDLENETIETVYSTKGWGFQLGANLNWGTTDRYLYTNDVIEGQAVCAQIDLKTGAVRALSGPMYHIAPDESSVIGFPLDIINATQRGYGVPENPETLKQIPSGLVKTEGIWKTDISTNTTRLLVSLADVAETIPDLSYYQGGTFYFFHSKFESTLKRLLLA